MDVDRGRCAWLFIAINVTVNRSFNHSKICSISSEKDLKMSSMVLVVSKSMSIWDSMMFTVSGNILQPAEVHALTASKSLITTQSVWNLTMHILQRIDGVFCGAEQESMHLISYLQSMISVRSLFVGFGLSCLDFDLFSSADSSAFFNSVRLSNRLLPLCRMCHPGMIQSL